MFALLHVTVFSLYPLLEANVSGQSDMVVAAPSAVFGLPEAERGLYAGAGGLSRAVRSLGMHLASQVVLAGRRLNANEAERHGLVNCVAQSQTSTVPEAVALASKVASLSPDAVIVSRAGLRQSWETASVERASQLTAEAWSDKLAKGENMKIGLEAFARKQTPCWVPASL